MKSSTVSPLFSRFLVFSISISLLCVQTMIASALPAKSVAAAEITVSGPTVGAEKPFVLVNGEQAFNGRTFFSNGTVATTETSSATVSLGKFGRITLAPSSSLSLSFSEGQISGTLSKGNVTVSNVDGVKVTLNTPHDTVTNEGTSSSSFGVNVLENETSVAVQSGTVLYDNGAKVASKQDDDDDDDEWKGWMTAAVIAGAVAAVVIIIVVTNDDDDVVSPVR